MGTPLYYLPVLHQPSNDCSTLIAPLLKADDKSADDMREVLLSLAQRLDGPTPTMSASLLAHLEAAINAMNAVDQDTALSVQPGEDGGLIAGGVLSSSMLVPVMKHACRAEDAELGEAIFECCGVLVGLCSGHGEHTLRLGLAPSSRPPLMLRCVPQGWGTGTRLWPAARLAIGALAAGWQGLALEGRSVLELGCGLAAVGLACASLGASNVWLTDFDKDALALAKRNVQLNGVGASCRVAPLDFMADVPATPHDCAHHDGARDGASARLDVDEMPAAFDLVVACDVLYDWDASWRETLGGIARYLAAGPHSRALCCFGTQKRSEVARRAVDDFTSAARAGVDACGLRLIASETVDEDGGEGVRMLLLQRV